MLQGSFLWNVKRSFSKGEPDTEEFAFRTGTPSPAISKSISISVAKRARCRHNILPERQERASRRHRLNQAPIVNCLSNLYAAFRLPSGRIGCLLCDPPKNWLPSLLHTALSAVENRALQGAKTVESLYGHSSFNNLKLTIYFLRLKTRSKSKQVIMINHKCLHYRLKNLTPIVPKSPIIFYSRRLLVSSSAK